VIDNKKHIDDFLEQEAVTFEGFIPDGIICIYPADDNRRGLLEKFKDNITSAYLGKIDDIDYSDKFFKKDPNKSIKKDNLTVDDFELLIDNPITKLLIIDDVIDEGKTLGILLDKLSDKELIDNNTEIKMACIYNNRKSDQIMRNPVHDRYPDPAMLKADHPACKTQNSNQI
jgi:hypoxanthine phosphoribosyltransferase